MQTHNASSIKELLKFWSEEKAQTIAYEKVIVESISPLKISFEGITWGGLYRRALEKAQNLKEKNVLKSNAFFALLHKGGLEFLVDFFACRIADIPITALYLPEKPMERYQNRAEQIIKASGVNGLLFGSSLASSEFLQSCQELVQVNQSNQPWDSFAILQFSSGTTGIPKGIPLTESMVLENTEAICKRVGFDSSMALVSWLPHAHDMGLIGALLVPFRVGGKGIIIDPMDFARSPEVWLEAISLKQAEASVAPNFAYELMTQKFSDVAYKWDLSKWKIAFNGAEPIWEKTINGFTKAFSPAGFRPESFFPCYGLAEATLMVTGCFGIKKNRESICLGKVIPGLSLKILGENGELRPSGEVGEICLSGSSVIKKYWGKPEYEDFLKTGDLGFLDENGELYFVGRKDNAFFYHGQKMQPEPIEEALADKGLEAYILAHEKNIIVCLKEEKAIQTVKEFFWIQYGFIPTIKTLKNRQIPKTTSGKVKRSELIKILTALSEV